MKIWICIPVFNRKDMTLRCLSTLVNQTYDHYQIVVCDHGSTDGTSDAIHAQYPDVIVLTGENSLWWTGAMNVCVNYVLGQAADEDYLLTLNNDTELDPDYLAEFASVADRYPRALIGSTLHDIETKARVSVGSRQNWLTASSTRVCFENDHLPGDDNLVEVTHVSGRGTLIPVEVFKKLGLYDEIHLPHYGADYDLSHKARRAGFPIYVCRRCRVYSYISANGMTTVRSKMSLTGFYNYLFSIRSPANFQARWWYAWNNCPKALLPTYVLLDFLRVIGGYFKHFLRNKYLS